MENPIYNGGFMRVLDEEEFLKLSGKIGEDGKVFNGIGISYGAYLTNLANLAKSISFNCYIHGDEEAEKYYLYKLISAISRINNIDFFDYEWLIDRDYSVFDLLPELDDINDINIDDFHIYKRVKKLIWCKKCEVH
jgi:hypothetical protein